MNAVYNEIEPFACNWLENLIERGHVAPGRVERRSIADLKPDDVSGPGQRHFFAGIGGWSYALRLAGVPDDADVWTGSCPCQPFSDAGEGLGVLDPRHLWPAWFALIEERRPSIIFGEQVASRDGLSWLDLVFSDLERCGYTVGAADLCAAGVGAPHIRQRLYFVAYADGAQLEGRIIRGKCADQRVAGSSGLVSPLADAASDTESGARSSSGEGLHERDQRRRGPIEALSSGPSSEWDECEWIPCRDGALRPVEPSAFPLAYGVPARVGRVCGYGNAIVPQVAAVFIRAALEAREEVMP